MTASAVVFRAVVPARPHGLWTLVCDFVEGPLLLTFDAPPAPCWSYADDIDARCGPDGDARALLSAKRCLAPTARVGALIGKIGGSSAAADDDGNTFIVGSHCLYRVETSGPLYLTINDDPTGMWNNAGAVTVTISSSVPETAPVPAAAAASKACHAVVVCCPQREDG